jgi:predicted HicB family RNase H-like nuclease
MQTFSQVIPRHDYYNGPAMLRPPIQLDPRVYDYLAPRAQARGISVDELVTEVLKKSIELSWKLDPPAVAR